MTRHLKHTLAMARRVASGADGRAAKFLAHCATPDLSAFARALITGEPLERFIRDGGEAEELLRAFAYPTICRELVTRLEVEALDAEE